MHNPELMCIFECICDLSCDADSLIDRNRTLLDAIRERWPFVSSSRRTRAANFANSARADR